MIHSQNGILRMSGSCFSTVFDEDLQTLILLLTLSEDPKLSMERLFKVVLRGSGCSFQEKNENTDQN